MADFDFAPYAIGGARRGDSFTGMQPAFRSALAQMFTDAPSELNLQVGSGFRSVERQRQLWEASDKSGRTVARPGGSRHNHGDAADLAAGGLRLDKASPQARQWVHDNAARYGLTFPMSYEPWHVELVGARGKGGPPAMAGTAPGTPAGAESFTQPAAIRPRCWRRCSCSRWTTSASGAASRRPTSGCGGPHSTVTARWRGCSARLGSSTNVPRADFRCVGPWEVNAPV